MKKVYTNPEIVFTSFEANDSLMAAINPRSYNQISFKRNSANVFTEQMQ